MTLPKQKDPEAWLRKIVASTKSYAVQNYIQHAEVCVDAGANVGGFIINYHNLFDKIYAFEASEKNVEMCKEHLSRFEINNANVAHAAVGKTVGESLILRMYDSKSDHFNCGDFSVTGFVWDDSGHGWQPSQYDEEVKSISLEAIVELTGPIDCLKVDVEGAEYDFLYQKDLSQVNFIFMEIHNFLVKLGQGHELVDWICKTHDIVTPYRGALDSHQELVFKRKSDAV